MEITGITKDGTIRIDAMNLIDELFRSFGEKLSAEFPIETTLEIDDDIQLKTQFAGTRREGVNYPSPKGTWLATPL